MIVATPDHWHAIQTIMACDAGKDVYIEKPLSLTIREGRRMVEAARRNNRVVQVGTQRRSSKLYAQLAELVQSGAIGKVTVARAGLDRQHVARRDRQGARLGPARRARLGHVARPACRAAVQPEHPAVQVPLVESLFVADGQLGCALPRRDALDRRTRRPRRRSRPTAASSP